MRRGVVVVVLLVVGSHVAVADPWWTVAARVGAHIAWDSLPDYDGTVDERRSGRSLELEIERRLLPELSVATFVRDHGSSSGPRTFDDVFVGLRLRVYLHPRLFVGAGYAFVDEQEEDIDPRRISAGCEGEIGVTMVRRDTMAIEAVLGVGRFTGAGPMFESETTWTQLAIGARFW